MKLPIPVDGRVLHGISEQAGNAGVIDQYRGVVGEAFEPSVYAAYEVFPGTRGLDSTIEHLTVALDRAMERAVALSIGIRFQSENGKASDVAIVSRVLDDQIRKLAAFLAARNGQPMLIRPGTETNTGTFGYGDRIADAYNHFVTIMLEEGVKASWCWCMEPHGSKLTFPDPTLVDWVGIDFFHAAPFAVPAAEATSGPPAQIHQAMSWAAQHAKPVAVCEASAVLATKRVVYGGTINETLAAGHEMWEGWFTPFGWFLARPEVKLAVLLPVDWRAAPKAGGPDWGDARIHMNPVTSARWGAWMQTGLTPYQGLGFVHRTEFLRSLPVPSLAPPTSMVESALLR